jgi:hypothetical protein
MSTVVTKLSDDEFSGNADARIIEAIRATVQGSYRERVATIKTFPVLYQGWEMDDVAYLVETESGKRLAFGTNHGGLERLEEEDLLRNIKRYNVAAKLTRKALAALRKKR